VKRIATTVVVALAFAGVDQAVAQIAESELPHHAVLSVSTPRAADGTVYVGQNTWARIVFGAWDLFRRSGIDRVHFVVRRHRPNQTYYLIRVEFVPGYKPPKEKKNGCTLADAYNPDDETELVDRGRIRFYVGCAIEREEPAKGSDEWVSAMAAILAHEIVHIISPGCKHGSDSSEVFGESIRLSQMTDAVTFSDRVVNECFGDYTS